MSVSTTIYLDADTSIDAGGSAEGNKVASVFVGDAFTTIHFNGVDGAFTARRLAAGLVEAAERVEAACSAAVAS